MSVAKNMRIALTSSGSSYQRFLSPIFARRLQPRLLGSASICSSIASKRARCAARSSSGSS